jgi:hypothetical protein
MEAAWLKGFKGLGDVDRSRSFYCASCDDGAEPGTDYNEVENAGVSPLRHATKPHGSGRDDGLIRDE